MKYDKDFCEKICMYRKPSQGRYQPAKITTLSRPAENRYYKLHNGDILDIQTKTILSRDVLKQLLDN